MQQSMIVDSLCKRIWGMAWAADAAACCALLVALLPASALAQTVTSPRETVGQPPSIADNEPLLDITAGPGCTLGAPDGRSQLKYRGITVSGNSVFSTEDLLAHMGLTGQAAGWALSIDDVECIRVALTQFYIAQGYINSGVLAQVPGTAGAPVLFRVVEGVLSDVRVQSVTKPDGTPGGLFPSYARERLVGDPDEPLRQSDLEGRFQALLSDPNIERLNGRLRPGANRGEAVLDVDVVQTKPLSFVVGANNFDPTSSGEYVGYAAASLRNQIGFGDAVALQFEGSQGRRSYSIDVEAPLSATGLLLVAGADYATRDIIEEPLDVLEIESEFLRISAGLTWKAYDIGTERLTFGLQFDFQESKTFLLSEPFSFSAGAEDGVSRASVLRAFAEYVRRSDRQAISVRGTASVGLPVFEPTLNNEPVPDAAFVTFLGEVFYVRSLELAFLDRDIELSVRGITQLSSDRLLSFEQVALTGSDVVRGLQEDAIVGDNLALIDLSARSPLFDVPLPYGDAVGQSSATIFGKPFVTAGSAWLKGDIGDRSTAVGGGFMLDVSPAPGLFVSLGFATPLYESRQVADLDVAETRLYFATEFRF